MTSPWTPEVELDLAQARARLARDFPDLAALPVTPAGEGWDCLAVRVGDELVARFARRELAATLMERELRWMPELAPHLPVPVSAPVRRGPADPFPYGVHRWVDGVTADRAELTDDERVALAPALGHLLRVLHQLPVPADAPGDVLGRGDGARRGARAIERLAELGIDVGARAWLDALPPPSDRRVWVHGDLYARHLVIGPDRALAGVIDWGDVHAGSPAADLSIGWSFVPPAGRAGFLAAYGLPVDAATWSHARLVALDYVGALIPYGRAQGDVAAEQLGFRVLATVTSG